MEQGTPKDGTMHGCIPSAKMALGMCRPVNGVVGHDIDESSPTQGGTVAKSKKAKKAPKRRFAIFIKWAAILSIIGALAGASVLAGIFYYYGQNLPKILKREDFKPAQMSRVYASSGELIAEFSMPKLGGKRTVVPMEKIPKHVRWSFMAAEDADFMKHSGIDYFGMVRAFYYAVFYDTGLKGTSTITQQVVKNLILTPERSIKRKVREIILAMELEKNLSKEDILWLYLNEVYMGHGVNGVEEAAKLYFNKPASKLKLEEAAVLAGITQSPERHSPIRNPKNALKRRHFVLKQLWEKGFIKEAAYRQADKAPLKLAPRQARAPHLGTAPHFVEHIRKTLISKYGKEALYTGGYRIHTTLDLKKQAAAQLAAQKGLRVYDKRHGLYRPKKQLDAKQVQSIIAKATKRTARGLKPKTRYKAVVTAINTKKQEVHVRVGKHKALLHLEPRQRIFDEKNNTVESIFKVNQLLHVWKYKDAEGKQPMQVQFVPGPETGAIILDPKTRDVLALVGSFDFAHNKYNHATQAKRQPGSTFKPIVYAAALEEKAITPATVIIDQPEVFKLARGKTYAPRNSDGQYRGPIRVREALGASRNVVSVHILVKKINVNKAIDFAKKIGIEGHLAKNATLVMGSSSNTVMEMVNAYATFASGGFLTEPRFIKRIETVRGETQSFASKPKAVISPEVAYLISDLMLAVTSGYTDNAGKRRAGTARIVSKLKHPVAGKTGTTNEAKDAWFIGYTPYYVGGVWVGHPDNRSLGRKEYGGRVAAPIWLEMMKTAHQDKKRIKFQPPTTGITTANIDPKTGLLMRSGGIVESFLAGTAPTDYAPEAQAGDVNNFIFDQVP